MYFSRLATGPGRPWSTSRSDESRFPWSALLLLSSNVHMVLLVLKADFVQEHSSPLLGRGKCQKLLKPLADFHSRNGLTDGAGLIYRFRRQNKLNSIELVEMANHTTSQTFEHHRA